MIDINLIKNKIEELENSYEYIDDEDYSLLYEYLEHYNKNRTDEELDEESIQFIYDVLILDCNDFVNYPLLLEYLVDHTCDFSLSTIETAALSCAMSHNSKKYKEIEFKLYYSLANMDFDHSGLIGGFFLVDMLLSVDHSKLEVAKYYLSKNKPVEAFRYLLAIRRDELTQKWYHESCNMNDKDVNKYLKKSFVGMNRLYHHNKIDDSLKLYLAYAYYYGIGTPINIDQTKLLLDGDLSFKSEYDLSIYSMLQECIEGDRRTITTLSTDSKIDDIVQLGLYDFRTITWKILDIIDDQYLLISDRCLESNYIVKEQLRVGKSGSLLRYSNKCKNFNQTFWVKEVFKNDIKNTLQKVSLKKCFLLNQNDLQKYFPTSDSRKVVCRSQASMNGYDNYGVEVDENGYSPYLVDSNFSSDDVVIVNTDGEFDYGKTYHSSIGIRPAIMVKLKNKNS